MKYITKEEEIEFDKICKEKKVPYLAVVPLYRFISKVKEEAIEKQNIRKANLLNLETLKQNKEKLISKKDLTTIKALGLMNDIIDLWKDTEKKINELNKLY